MGGSGLREAIRVHTINKMYPAYRCHLQPQILAGDKSKVIRMFHTEADSKYERGRSPLSYAAENGCLEIM